MKIYRIKSFYKRLHDYYSDEMITNAALVIAIFKITRGTYNDSFKKEKI